MVKALSGTFAFGHIKQKHSLKMIGFDYFQVTKNTKISGDW